ncbi:MAG: hypothetical protein IKP74_07685 [Clostridia bacterium]|nr:hypothetical protein [Clostridia bacterium]
MKPTIFRMIRITAALLLLVCLCGTFCGCISFWKNQIAIKQGKYPKTSDFPNTRWAFRELDLKVDMIEHVDTMYGTYSVNGKEYRAEGFFYNHGTGGQLDFVFYESTEKTVSEHDADLVHCERIRAGYLDLYYSYDKETNLINCTLQRSQPVDGETIPEKLTLEQTGTFSPTPDTRWFAEELDLYLDSYSDVQGYFCGEMSIDGKKYVVHAIETGNGDYYVLYRNGSYMVNLIFKKTDDRIVATVTDDRMDEIESYKPSRPIWYDYWNDELKTVTFHPTYIE